MTRSDAGRRHRTWRESDFARIRELAGRVPAREIRRRLKLSENQLEGALRVMRSRGERVSLRCFRPRTSVCPSCGCARSLFGSEGICEPCRLARRLREVEAEAAELLPLLSPADRATYERTESSRASGTDPMPARPSTRGMDPYRVARAEEEYDLAVERWQARRLRRLLKAAQKRKERMAKKARRI